MSYTIKQEKEIKKIRNNILHHLRVKDSNFYIQIYNNYPLKKKPANILNFIVYLMYNFNIIDKNEYEILGNLSNYNYEDSNYLIAVYMCNEKFKKYTKNLKKQK